jgi:hypothetical protein
MFSPEELLDRVRAEDVVTRLFVSTDRRDWAGVRACFAPSVQFDMTSVAGGAPATLTPERIASGWETGLAGVEQIHHQAGNFVTDVNGNEVTIFCYAIAIHHKKTRSGQNTRTFVGSYDVTLQRHKGQWLISAFRFNLKFLEGNLNLEKES